MQPITLTRDQAVERWFRELRRWQELDLAVCEYLGLRVPQPNLALLRKAIAHIDNDPESWRQGSWNGCVVGWALQYAGVIGPDDPADPVEWLVLGAETLGLLPVEVMFLADGDNDRTDIDTTARVIALRAGEEL